jgi:drug/metabolite transporter (DMT)-like permease
MASTAQRAQAPTALRAIALTTLTLIAFAANSLLCRMALGGEHIDAASYTSLRLLSGAVTLWAIVTVMRNGAGAAPARGEGARWLSAAMLFVYAIALSFAYLGLDTGIGALILFGCVQVTMIIGGMLRGHRPSALEWLGLAVAFAGLIYLVSPGLTAPDTSSALLMALSGIAWGVYSLRGQGGGDPVVETSANFVRAAPMALLVSLTLLVALPIESFHVNVAGAALAVLSGAVASGLGYVLWYAALKYLTATRAAVVQLAVPVLAAVGGVLLLAEPVTARLVLASAVILGGVALAILGKRRP